MSALAALYGTVWAVLPSYFRAMSRAWETRRVDVEGLLQRAEERRVVEPGSKAAAPKNAIAVVPVVGPIANRPDAMTEMCGWPSAMQLAGTVEALVADPKVKAIVLDMDTPGGVASGVPEAASRIYRARGTKPIVAVANGMAASAGYWIGAAADKLYVTPSGEVGSVGVFSVHYDESKALDEMGVKPTIIKAGKYKAEMNPFEPLTAEARDYEQGVVDGIYSEFVNAVASYRGTTANRVRSDFGEGRTVGAKAAVEAGMADGVATLQQVISRIQSGKLTMATLGSQATEWGDEPTLVEVEAEQRLAARKRRMRLAGT